MIIRAGRQINAAAWPAAIVPFPGGAPPGILAITPGDETIFAIFTQAMLTPGD